MYNERTNISDSGRTSKFDDLKLIIGIGPAVERRLRRVGIDTYAQLAALSPADIAAAVENLAGLSADRITKQDWIGQARRLSSELTSSEVQEGKEALVEVEAPIEPAHPSISSDEIPLSATPVEVTEPVPSTGVPRLSKIKTVLASATMTQNLFDHDQPFKVFFTLDFINVRVPTDTEFRYKATIYSKNFEGLARQVIGETNGIITSTDKVTVSVNGLTLPKGLHRLKAIVILNPTKAALTPQNSLMASKESDLLLII